MENNDLPKIAILFLLTLINSLFVLVMMFVFGYFFGAVSLKNKYTEGVKDGEKKGRYELYLELEGRDIGRFNSKTETFEFHGINREKGK